MALGAATNCYSLSITTFGEAISTIAAVITLVICFGFPLYVYVKLFKKPITPDGIMYENEQYKAEHGVLYEGIRVKHESCLMHTVIKLLRELFYVIVMCVLRDRPLA